LGVPIVAVGGGGYNPTTVPRMWTLATAALSDLNLPDAVPLGYAYQSEMPTLNDHFEMEMPERETKTAQAFADRSTGEIKNLLFLQYGLNNR
jgi:acetoin utilization protein AcuC